MATDTCQYPSGRCCPNPPLEGDKNNYCIFHSRQDSKDKDAFWNGIQKKLKDRDFYFEGYYFPPGLKADFSGVEFIDAFFWGTIFKDDATFHKAKFSGESDTIFIGANFLREADFSDTEFSGKGGTYFSGAIFYGKSSTNFSGANFSGEGGTSFSRARFAGEGGTYFNLVRFSGKGCIDFGEARFSGSTYFWAAQFLGEGGTYFSNTEFSGKGDTDFSYASFSGKGGTNFRNADFSESITTSFIDTEFTVNCEFQYAKFPWKSDQFVFFQSVRRLIDLGKCSFLYCNTERLIFRNFKFLENEPEELFNIKFPLCKRRVVLPDEYKVGGWVKVSKETARKKQGEALRVEYSHVEALYRQFKKNLESERDWETAGEFHYGEMECKRKGITSQWPRLAWIRQNFGLLAWYKYFSGYGERPFRAFCWIAFLLPFFAEIYCLLDVPPRQGFFYYFWEMSVKAAFLQRVGETGHEPILPLGKLIYLFQSALCPTLIALFILALRRRVRR